jgi:hypothetical protein
MFQIIKEHKLDIWQEDSYMSNEKTSKDFSIVDTDKNIEVIVFTDFNSNTKQWEAVYSHATDIESGMPVYVDDRGMYLEKVRLYLKEINNATNRD